MKSSLSRKRVLYIMWNGKMRYRYWEEDIKEAVKRLKEFFVAKNYQEKIDKIFGEKLTK